MNTSGLIKGGLAAGLLINVSEFVLNTLVVPVPEGEAGSLVFWVVYAFLLGLLVAYVSALTRARWGAGAKTGIYAGIVVWLLHTLLPAAGMANMGLMDLSLVGLGWTLVEMSVAGVLAGRLYREA